MEANSNEMVQAFNKIARQHPSKIALKYSNKETKRSRGLQWITWKIKVEKKLSDYNLKWDSAIEMTKNKECWNGFCEKMLLMNKLVRTGLKVKKIFSYANTGSYSVVLTFLLFNGFGSFSWCSTFK